MVATFAVLANMIETMKSPTCEVVTGAPGVLLKVRFPVTILAASGRADEIPDTSQTAIIVAVGAVANVGVTTVAPAFEFTAYQISVDQILEAPLAPPETYVLPALSETPVTDVVPLNISATASKCPAVVAGIVRLVIAPPFPVLCTMVQAVFAVKLAVAV